jgi:hypothetical protein
MQCDSVSNLFLINGNTGEILDQIHCNNNIESSPAVYNNMIVVAERFGKIYGIRIE